MKNVNKYEIKKESIITKIDDKKNEVKEIISWLDEWKDSKDMKQILLNNIRKIEFEIKMLETELKVINVIEHLMIKQQPKASR